MIERIQDFYLRTPEPYRSCMLAVRDQVLVYDDDITETWKYKLPFYCYRGKMLCYLHVQVKSGRLYMGVPNGKAIEHPLLLQEGRARMKALYLDTEADLPVDMIDLILEKSITYLRQ